MDVDDGRPARAQHLLEVPRGLRAASAPELVDGEVLLRRVEARVDGERLAEAGVGLVDATRPGEREAEQVEPLEVARSLSQPRLEHANRRRELAALHL